VYFDSGYDIRISAYQDVIAVPAGDSNYVPKQVIVLVKYTWIALANIAMPLVSDR